MGLTSVLNFKEISSRAAILFAPLAGAISGMDFEVAPEPKRGAGYPFAALRMPRRRHLARTGAQRLTLHTSPCPAW
ncbi:hypothetical protein Sxan_39380 [Streptomyces xanthophaeus]|uniref:Uncharacterized protein n=1 Tax=Streptomyces xanthophaeus TaxID=67385 RepID=A0A919H368_9ACTN|nr:hypothetical protein Sxan_39380 [Streptomyces xanthophaeus]